MGEHHKPAIWTGSGRKRSVRAKSTEAEATAGESAGTDATDAAKALAAERGVDLSTVTGTGAEGRITKDDVEAASQPEPEPEPEPEPAEEADAA